MQEICTCEALCDTLNFTVHLYTLGFPQWPRRFGVCSSWRHAVLPASDQLVRTNVFSAFANVFFSPPDAQTQITVSAASIELVLQKMYTY